MQSVVRSSLVGLLALASLYTVAQRVLVVRRQAFAKMAAEQAAGGQLPNG